MPLSPRTLRPANNFSPRSISGLVGWWDFSDASTLGPSSSGTGTVLNNGPIKYVADKSRASAAMIQTGADSVSPTYLAAAQNGRNVAGFDGGDSVTCNFAKTFTSQTVFGVTRLTSAAAINARLFSQSDSGNDFETSGHYIPIMRNGGGASILSFALGGSRAAVSVPYDTWFIACSRHTGSQIQNRVNNGSAATYNHTLNFSVTRLCVGASVNAGGGGNWADAIGESLVFDRAISDSEMNAVASWLGKKWNITVA